MKTVLCYGDSNTWGYDPVSQSRFDIHTRWAGVARDLLGSDWHVIEEGLNGRTTVWDDPIEGDKNGKTYLPPCLATHRPLDVVCSARTIAKCASRCLPVISRLVWAFW
jgi:lysophospholipase L1-like esterase